MSFDLKKIRENFPALSQTYNKKPVIYFDNACMTLKPIQVSDHWKNNNFKYNLEVI